MSGIEQIQVTIAVDADLLSEVADAETLSDFVNQALRRVRELRARPEELSRLVQELQASSHPSAASAASSRSPTIQDQLSQAAAEKAAEAAAEKAEISKWDQYLS
jgi:hypothetical protein